MTDHGTQHAKSASIDGFAIVRSLDDQEPARTLLVKRSDSSDTAVLKFLSQDSAERLLLQQVSNPHIAQFVGSGGDTEPYVLLAYYGQRDLRTYLSQGVHVSQLLQLLLQLADALDALHAIGFLHGDLRPEHVVIKANGQPVIVNLSCCRAIDGVRHASDSAVPAYLSPELAQDLHQHSQTPSGGASDYFSLGVLAFEMLVGRLPQAEETPGATAQPYLQDSPPRLPAHLQPLQAIIDGLMAKDPEKRISSKGALQHCIGNLPVDTDLETMVLRDAAISTSELSSLFADLRLRPDELARQNRRLRRKRRRRIALQGTLTLILTGSILAGLFTFREQLLPVVEDAAAYVGVIENPELTAAWREAQSLASDPNQGLGTIVAAYRRVMAIAPEHSEAADALAQTTQAWKQSIGAAMSENDLSRAEVLLTEAQDLFESDPELTVLSLRLQNHQRAERLLASTQSLLRSSGLSDEASAAAAVQAFEEILRISPDHVEAAQGLTEISKHYGQLAAAAAARRDVDQAIRLLQRATAARSDLRELDQVRELISEATSIQAAMAALLTRAQELIDAGRLIEPTDNNAAELYLQVLATDPENPAAAAGLLEVTKRVMATIQDQLNQGDIDQAQASLGKAENARLDAIAIANMGERIDSEITSRSQVTVALEQASVLFEQGFISAPDEQNAVAKLQEVLILDPGNEIAQRRLIACAERLAEVAAAAQAVGMSEAAKRYISKALSIQPGVSQWKAWQAQW